MRKTNGVAPLTLSVEEAARRIGMGTRQLRAAVKRGILPSVDVGTRRVRIPVAALERYINGERAA